MEWLGMPRQLTWHCLRTILTPFDNFECVFYDVLEDINLSFKMFVETTNCEFWCPWLFLWHRPRCTCNDINYNLRHQCGHLNILQRQVRCLHFIMNSSCNVQYDVGEQNNVTLDINVIEYNIQHDIDMASHTCPT